jgi:hypothetical protein
LEAQVVLTKVMVTDRRFCKAYFHYAPLMEDIARNATPMWNGEDIFMSLVSQKVDPAITLTVITSLALLSWYVTKVHLSVKLN